MRRWAGIVRGVVDRAATVALVSATVTGAFGGSGVPTGLRRTRTLAVPGPVNAAHPEPLVTASHHLRGALETVPRGRRPNARSGCQDGDSEGCRAALAVTVRLTYVRSWSSSTQRTPGRLRLRASIGGTRTGNTVGRHRSQRAPGGPGSQGRSALTTGAPGVGSARCRPTVRTHVRRHAAQSAPRSHRPAKAPSIAAAMSSA